MQAQVRAPDPEPLLDLELVLVPVRVRVRDAAVRERDCIRAHQRRQERLRL